MLSNFGCKIAFYSAHFQQETLLHTLDHKDTQV